MVERKEKQNAGQAQCRDVNPNKEEGGEEIDTWMAGTSTSKLYGDGDWEGRLREQCMGRLQSKRREVLRKGGNGGSARKKRERTNRLQCEQHRIEEKGRSTKHEIHLGQQGKKE